MNLKPESLTSHEVISETDGMSPAVVVLSGGQDSTTCLALAATLHEKVYCISFNYGQRHSDEIERAKLIAPEFPNVLDHIVLDLDCLAAIGNSALIVGDEQDDVNKDHATKDGLPASFVPNRNAMFLTLAHAYAQKVGAKAVYTGVCQTDYSGYPDCREIFIAQLQRTLNLGSNSDISIKTPLMFMTKAETFEMASNLGALDIVLNKTLTCYEGDTTMNEWGAGCGACPACGLRANGWEEFKNDF